MKTLKQFVESAQNTKLNVQSDAVNYLSVGQLNNYLKAAKPFLSEDTLNIIKYLIDNNTTYISELSTDDSENALEGFYNSGKATTQELKDLKTWIKNVVNSGRILEIPVFQTEDQFNAIINNEVAPDEIILDLKSEAGKNLVAKKYEPLVHKLCKQFHGKSNFSYDDLLGIAYEGLTLAMNSYGKTKDKNTEEKNNAIKKYTFGQYAAYVIRNVILDNIKNFSHTVRIPISQQQKEKKETGKNRKSITVSGDKPVGHDDEGNKSIFDFMSDLNDPSNKLNKEDIDRLWNNIFTELEKEFEPNLINLFYSFYGLNGHKELKNNELCKKYNIKPSQVTYYCYRIRKYIMTNKKLFNELLDIYDLMKESRNEYDRNIINEPLHIDYNNNF